MFDCLLPNREGHGSGIMNPTIFQKLFGLRE